MTRAASTLDVALLAAVAALVLVAWLSVLRAGRQRRASLLWSGGANPPGFRAARWRALLLVLAAACGVVSALDRESSATTIRQKDAAQRTLVFALDVSRSMDASDVAPTRRDLAQRVIAGLVGGTEPLRAGLVIFSGEALLVCPITADAGAQQLALADVANIRDVIDGGSALGAAIARAIGAVPEDEADAAIVLLSDGEDTLGDWDTPIAQAVSRGIVIHTVGIGTVAGQSMAARSDDVSSAAGPPEQRLTRLDEVRLRAIAEATGGRYVAWTGPEATRVVDSLIRAPGARPPAAAATQPRTQILLLLMFGCLACEPLVGRVAGGAAHG